MTKLEQVAHYLTTAHDCTFSALSGSERLDVVKSYYKDNGLTKPATITRTATKRGGYLSKDEKLAIQSAYILALKSGNVDEQTEKNFAAVTDADAVATFTTTKNYTDAINEWGGTFVASALIDLLPVDLNEKFHKIRAHHVGASVDVDAIPAFIQELQKIWDEAHKADKPETDVK